MLSCFKAYDVRGKVPEELNDDIATRIGWAFATHFKAKRIAVGHDVRLSSPALTAAFIRGVNDAGADVIHLGLCGTEEIYFASFHLDVDGGAIITASHNPAEYNGMKFILRGACPVSGDSGLTEVAKLATDWTEEVSRAPGKAQERPTDATPPPVAARGTVAAFDNRPAYLEHLLSYVDLTQLKALRIVVDSGNGCAGPIIDGLENSLPFIFIKINHEPDGTFPRGVPNPLLPENREATARAVREHGADFGIAWDGDFDRCFFYDEQGNFIEGYYLVGLLAEAMLVRAPRQKIIHDPRLVWNTREIVTAAGGIPVMSKTGHAFIKERMRKENALYGGEMSAHHYFREFGFCDSGMIPWLLVAELLSRKGQVLSQMVAERIARYPVSGEINRRVAGADDAIARIAASCKGLGGTIDHTDGFSFEADAFRLNVRKSNTEPVLRLNVETRGDRELLQAKTAELLALMADGP